MLRLLKKYFFYSLLFVPFAASGQDLELSAKATKQKSADSRQFKAAGKYAGTALKPIFPRFEYNLSNNFADLVGRDPNVVAKMDYRSEAARVRENQLRQLVADFKLQKPGSEQALRLGESILEIAQQQAIYFENLRAFKSSDSKYTDVNHFIKAAHAIVVDQAGKLITQFPRSERVIAWKVAGIQSRLKIGDATAIKDAKNVIRSKKNDVASSLFTWMVVSAAARKQKSDVGTLTEALSLPVDNLTRSVILFFQAEQYAFAKQNDKASVLYLEAAKAAREFSGVSGSTNPVTLMSATRIIQLSVLPTAPTMEREYVTNFSSLGLQNAANAYVEQVALRNLASQPARAMTYYADLLTISALNTSEIGKVELRILDIALGIKDTQIIDQQWQRLANIAGAITSDFAQPRIQATHEILWGIFQKNQSEATLEQFLRVHDFIMAQHPTFKGRESWGLLALDGTFRINQFEKCATRADQLFNSTSSAKTKISALGFAIKSREKILGIASEPTFATNLALQNRELAILYVKNLDQMVSLIKAADKNKITASFQAAYISYQLGDVDSGRKRFESLLGLYPKSPFAGKSVSYLITIAAKAKDFMYLEKIARLAITKKVDAFKKEHANLRAIVEMAVWEQAQALQAQKQLEPAAQKYVAFQKEFPKSSNADKALYIAAKNYETVAKQEASLKQMEALLTVYPKSKYDKEIRFAAATKAKSLNQSLRAAGHFVVFAKSYPADGMRQKAWLSAGDLFVAGGKYGESVSSYESHMKHVTSKSEKMKAARLIAEVQIKYGNAASAESALARVSSMATSVDDTMWANSELMELHLNAGRKKQAKTIADKLAKMKPSGQEGFRVKAKARYLIGMTIVDEVKAQNPENASKLRKALQNYVARYEEAKKNLLAPCEVPGLEWCALGYYETSRLAEHVAGKLTQVELPPTLNPSEVVPIRGFASEQSNRLGAEAKSLAEQAEQSLTTSAANKDMAEKIRNYARDMRGESSAP